MDRRSFLSRCLAAAAALTMPWRGSRASTPTPPAFAALATQDFPFRWAAPDVALPFLRERLHAALGATNAGPFRGHPAGTLLLVESATTWAGDGTAEVRVMMRRRHGARWGEFPHPAGGVALVVDSRGNPLYPEADFEALPIPEDAALEPPPPVFEAILSPPA